MTTLVIIALVVIVGGYFISTQRSLVNLDELCKNALSQIEVQLNSRFDAVIALAKTAAQYAKHESETIIQAVQARGGNLQAFWRHMGITLHHFQRFPAAQALQFMGGRSRLPVPCCKGVPQVMPPEILNTRTLERRPPCLGNDLQMGLPS